MCEIALQKFKVYRIKKKNHPKLEHSEEDFLVLGSQRKV